MPARLPSLVLLTPLAVAGCMAGPEPARPEVPFDLGGPYAAAGEAGDAHLGYAGWWRGFGDPATERVAEAALLGNLDLRAAAARVRQSRAVLAQAYGARFPAVGASLTGSGRGTSDTGGGAGFFPTGTGGGDAGPGAGDPGGAGAGGTGDQALGFPTQDDFVETYDLSANVAWQLDLFGRLRRLQQAATLDYAATATDRLALAHSVVASAIRSRVAIGTLGQRVALAEGNLASLRETLRVVKDRYAAGVGDPVELRLARANVANARATLPPLRAQLAVERHALAVLLGRRVADVADLPATLPPLPELPLPPVGLPAALLDRRPDLLASEFRARAQQARIGAAVADLFPDVTLSASAGLASNDVGDLLDTDSFVYTLVGSIAQPIFQGGQLRARVRQTEAAADEAAADYAGLVLTAFREVNDALVRESNGREEVAASAEALRESRAAEELARERYSRGVGNLLSVFEAERNRRSAEERLALARQGVWDARVNLHLALGGDWGLAPTLRPAHAGPSRTQVRRGETRLVDATNPRETP